MADEAPKKEEEKEEKKSSGDFWMTASTGTIVGLGLLLYFLFNYFLRRFGTASGDFNFQDLAERIRYSLPDPVRHGIVGFIIFTTLLSFFFLISTVYIFIKHRDVEARWRKMIYPDSLALETKSKPKSSRWIRVMEHIGSENPSDWRLAILESDIMLEDLLDELGYYGDTIGDKLKRVNRGDFQTIDMAWEAHKIRNAIAHEGQDFVLTQREAQRIIYLYKQVFDEFDFIEKTDEPKFNPPPEK